MDTNLLIAQARARFNHQQSALQLHEKYTAQLTRAWGGGLWRITPELLGYLKTAPAVTVLLDTFNTPVLVDSTALYEFMQPIYNSVMDAWLTEHNALKTNR